MANTVDSDFFFAHAIKDDVTIRNGHDASHAGAAGFIACIGMLQKEVHHLLDARLHLARALRISLVNVIEHAV